MIYDRFDNVMQYFKEGEPLHRAVTYASNLDLSLADGRYEIDGDALYAMVASYETSSPEERRFEAHRKYIDVQVVFEGKERIEVSLDTDLRVLEDYSEANDIAFFKQPETYSVLMMKSGYFAIFFPHDIHRPGCNLLGPESVRKMVVKVAI